MNKNLDHLFDIALAALKSIAQEGRFYRYEPNQDFGCNTDDAYHDGIRVGESNMGELAREALLEIGSHE
jgi:hypothetical protein